MELLCYRLFLSRPQFGLTAFGWNRVSYAMTGQTAPASPPALHVLAGHDGDSAFSL